MLSLKMKYIAMNRFKIILGKEKEFEEVRELVKPIWMNKGLTNFIS